MVRHHPFTTITVDESSIPQAGWLQLDLPRLRAQLAEPAAAQPVVETVAVPPALPDVVPRRIPEADIVCIGRVLDLAHLPSGSDVPGAVAPARAANENGRLRLLLLVILAFALSGSAYWAMRITQPNVIVVPAPTSPGSKIA